MRRFWTVFTAWFIALVLLWLLANVIGLFGTNMLKPFNITGFPFIIAAWGWGIEEFFSLQALMLNTFIAVVTSALVAWLCAISRGRGMPSRPSGTGASIQTAPGRESMGES